MKKILITPQAFDILDDMIFEVLGKKFEIIKTGGQIHNQKSLIKQLSQVDGCVIGAEQVGEDVFKKCPKLKILSRFGSGYNSINIDAAVKFGVSVCIVPNEINASAVARHALSLLFSLTNNIVTQTFSHKKGVWSKTFNLSPKRTAVGVVGFGPIGREFARLCHFHGFSINYFSRENKNVEKYNYFNSLKDIILSSDIVSLHLNCNKETRGVFDNKLLKLLNGKLLINTSRGELIDEESLLLLLSNKTIKGAALDVFGNEPFSGISAQLAKQENVISTSHTGAYDFSTIQSTGRISLENIKYFFENDARKVDRFVSEFHS